MESAERSRQAVSRSPIVGSLASEAMSAAKAAVLVRAPGLQVAEVQRVWGAWGASPLSLDSEWGGPGGGFEVPGFGFGGRNAARVAGSAECEEPLESVEEDEEVALSQLLRFLSYRGGAVTECCPAALTEMYEKAEGICKGPPGSPRNGNKIVRFKCGADGGGGCRCCATCVGFGTPATGTTYDVSPTSACSLRDYLGFGEFGMVGGEGDGGFEEPEPEKRCKVEVGVRHFDGVGRLFLHAYVITTDEEGTQLAYHGAYDGPGCEDSRFGCLWMRAPSSTNGISKGELSIIPWIEVPLPEEDEACEAVGMIRDVSAAITAARRPYSPDGTYNSNSAAYTLVLAGTGVDMASPDRRAVGWGVEVPL